MRRWIGGRQSGGQLPVGRPYWLLTNSPQWSWFHVLSQSRSGMSWLLCVIFWLAIYATYFWAFLQLLISQIWVPRVTHGLKHVPWWCGNLAGSKWLQIRGGQSPGSACLAFCQWGSVRSLPLPGVGRLDPCCCQVRVGQVPFFFNFFWGFFDIFLALHCV